MEEGVLCLKWRDHRSAFLRMLASTRKKGAFCDATLVCEGKFYPVHQLVLSTCSEYFQHMFEAIGAGASRTAGPMHAAAPLLVVVAGVSQHDLEALLEYMYAGEATVLQAELAHFMKAAEGLKIRGLAEPTPAASRPASPRGAGESSKRPLPQSEDTWGAKRKRESGGSQRAARGRTLSDIVSPAQLAAVELAPEALDGTERDMATGTPGDLPGAVAPLSPPLIYPLVKFEEVLVKDEPQQPQEEEEEDLGTGQEREWGQQQGRRQHQQQHQATTLEDMGDAAQLLGFCDPGLTYLAHSSGLGVLTDPGHPSHHPANYHQRRMGRPTSEIWLHYSTERVAGKTAVYCRYCAQKYGYPNATKMKIHTMKCAKCPEEVKRQFEGTTKPDLVECQDRLGTDGGGTSKADSILQYQPHQTHQVVERSNDSTNVSGRAKQGIDNPSISIKAGPHPSENASPIKSQNLVVHDAVSKPEGASASKSKQRQYPSPDKAASSSKLSSSSPEKAHGENILSPSKAQQQHHSKPSSRPDDRVSLRSERQCHNPVF